MSPKVAQAVDLELAFLGSLGIGRLGGAAGIAWALVASRATYGMPVFLMNSLMVEALLQTDLPEEIDAGEVKWPFPALRLLLPLGLFSLDSEIGTLPVGFVDIGMSVNGQSVRIPKPAEDELRKITGTGSKLTWDFDGVMLSTEVIPPSGNFQVLAKHFPWEDAVKNDISIDETMPHARSLNEDDKQLMRKLTVVAVNTLMITASHPELVTREVLLERADPRRSRKTRQALYRPGMIGFPKWPEEPRGRSENHTDIKLAPHWVRGQWRRQHYGPEGSQVRPKWILPYRTGHAQKAG